MQNFLSTSSQPDSILSPRELKKYIQNKYQKELLPNFEYAYNLGHNEESAPVAASAHYEPVERAKVKNREYSPVRNRDLPKSKSPFRGTQDIIPQNEGLAMSSGHGSNLYNYSSSRA